MRLRTLWDWIWNALALIFNCLKISLGIGLSCIHLLFLLRYQRFHITVLPFAEVNKHPRIAQLRRAVGTIKDNHEFHLMRPLSGKRLFFLMLSWLFWPSQRRLGVKCGVPGGKRRGDSCCGYQRFTHLRAWCAPAENFNSLSARWNGSCVGLIKQ